MPSIRAEQPLARTMVESALRLAGVIARKGQDPTTEELNDCLAFLNDMLESWNIQRLFIYETSRETFPLTPNRNPHTIGLASGVHGDGDFATAWPPKIESASVIQSETEIPVEILSKNQYQGLSNKNAASTFPTDLWHERSWPLAKIHLYPVPSSASTLVLYLWKQLNSGLELDTRLSVPQGYLRAIRFNLAVETALDYGLSVNPDVSRIARESKAAIGNLNTLDPSYMRADKTLIGIGSVSGYNIRSNNFQ